LRDLNGVSHAGLRQKVGLPRDISIFMEGTLTVPNITANTQI